MNQFAILMRRDKHSKMLEEDKRRIILVEGETFLEYQDQYKGKWYERFMNPVRIKYGDGSTVYSNLPFSNGIFKPMTKFIIITAAMTIQLLLCMILIFTL